MLGYIYIYSALTSIDIVASGVKVQPHPTVAKVALIIGIKVSNLPLVARL